MRRGAAFGLIAAVVVGLAIGYVILAARGPAETSRGEGGRTVVAGSGESYVAFRRTAVDADYGTVGLVPYDAPTSAPSPTDLTCERIHMSPTSGICLLVKRGVATTAEVLLLDGDMSVRHRLGTPGVPSRARVSPDGRWAATTTFVFGHSYADSQFSTQTEIYDVASGESLGNVEKWDVTYNGEPYRAEDINIWGVSFSVDGDSFYATIRTAEQIHLAQGSIAERTLTMTDVSAECPSLSPSGLKLAFKSATGPGRWQVRVRTLADGSEVVIAESRSVDDQIEWWDDDTVLYGLAREEVAAGGATADVWAAPADGSGESELLIPGGWSPAVVRMP